MCHVDINSTCVTFILFFPFLSSLLLFLFSNQSVVQSVKGARWRLVKSKGKELDAATCPSHAHSVPIGSRRHLTLKIDET